MKNILAGIRTAWSHVEAKVKAAGLWTLAAAIVIAVVNALLNGSVVPNSPHAWVQFVITVSGAPVAAFVAGWRAKHTPVLPAELPSTTTTPPAP